MLENEIALVTGASRGIGEAIAHGLAAEEPVPGLIAGVLDRCEAALDARGRDEGRLLAPLRARLAARQRSFSNSPTSSPCQA